MWSGPSSINILNCSSTLVNILQSLEYVRRQIFEAVFGTSGVPKMSFQKLWLETNTLRRRTASYRFETLVDFFWYLSSFFLLLAWISPRFRRIALDTGTCYWMGALFSNRLSPASFAVTLSVWVPCLVTGHRNENKNSHIPIPLQSR